LYAVYVRVSTEKDSQVSSIDNQIDICRNWIERNGLEWDEDKVYKDEGISGTLFTERPAIQLILRKAKNKEINTVIFKSISRLARDLKDSLEIREVLLAHGVRIISVEEAYDSDKAGKNDMAFELWSMFAAQYSRTLSSSVSAALTAKARRGETPWRPAYGYRTDENHRMILHEEEAEVVRDVFTMYRSGIGYRGIATKLNERGIKPRRAANWTMGQVRQMVGNRVYTGDYIVNKHGKVKLAGKKKNIVNSEEKWLVFENHHPGIISKEMWQECNRNRRKRTKTAQWNEFRGLLYCAECGGPMVFHNSSSTSEYQYQYAKCSRYQNAKLCLSHKPIKYPEIRELVLERLMKKAEDIEEGFINNVQVDNEKRIAELEGNIQRLKEKKKKLVTLQIEGLLELEEFAEMRTGLDKDIEKAEEQLFVLRQSEYVDVTAKSIRDAFLQLRDSKRDLAHVFQTLLKAIHVHEDTTVDIDYTF